MHVIISSSFPPFCSPIYSELTSLIESTNADDSPYQISQAAASTDATIYPPPSSAEKNGPSSNKRKRNEDGSAAPAHLNETVNARYPELVHTNKIILKLHETVKSECAQLSDSCVCIWPFIWAFVDHT
jgi:proteasome activator subunit 3 (PA28 gamma)